MTLRALQSAVEQEPEGRQYRCVFAIRLAEQNGLSKQQYLTVLRKIHSALSEFDEQLGVVQFPFDTGYCESALIKQVDAARAAIQKVNADAQVAADTSKEVAEEVAKAEGQ